MSIPLTALRRSAGQVLAWAVLDLFPGAHLLGGGTSEQDFYYDFIFSEILRPEILPLIEEKMRDLIRQGYPIRILEMMRENAVAFLDHKNQPYRALDVARSNQRVVSLMQSENFSDFCLTPLVANTAEIQAFKLLSLEEIVHYVPEEGEVSGTRIRGTAFFDKGLVKKAAKAAIALKKRDHRVFAKEMDLFSCKEEAGEGYFFWHPKGAYMRESLISLWKNELSKSKVQLIFSPTMVKSSLFALPGFLDDYSPITHSFEGLEYLLRPSFTPLHAIYYKSSLYSYRELPIRVAESGELYNYYKREELSGISRQRAFYSEASHIFCTEEQVVDELISSLQFIDRMIKILGFECQWYLSPRGKKIVGTIATWEKGELWLREALKRSGFFYTEDPFLHSFSGPFVEGRFVDSLHREWKGPVVGLDFNCPQRLGLRYQGKDGEMHSPIMLQRKVFSSFDHLIAIMLEHYNGHVPMWMTPEQVRVIPLGESNFRFARGLVNELHAAGWRAGIDEKDHPLGSKVHAAELARIPYLVVIGDKEEKRGVISVRNSRQERAQREMKPNEFMKILEKERQT